MTRDLRSTSWCAQAVGLGVVAGMRSQLPLALLAFAASQGRFIPNDASTLSVLRSPVASRLLGLSALGEFAADKLPFLPSRLTPGPLFGRMLFGGAAGAAVAAEARRSPAVGAVLGAAGAVLGANAGYHTRAWLGRTTGAPDPVWAAGEDAAVIALGLAVLRSLPEPSEHKDRVA